MAINEAAIDTSLLSCQENNRYRDSCPYKCLITIARIAADTLAVVPVLGLGFGAFYLENLYGINSKLIQIITSIGVVAMMFCSISIVHMSCNKWLQIEDDDVSPSTFIPI